MDLDVAVNSVVALAAQYGAAATCLIVADPAQAAYVMSQALRFVDQAGSGDLVADEQLINLNGGGVDQGQDLVANR